MNLKKIVLSFSCCLATCAALAQDTLTEKGTLTLRSGISVPKGNFARKDPNSKGAGFAAQGGHLAVEYHLPIDNYFGLGFTAGLRRNQMELEEYNKQFAPIVSYAHTLWRTNYFLLNTTFKYPLAPVLNLFFKVGGGFSDNAYPFITTTDSPNSKPKPIKAQGLAYGAGGGIQWQGKRAGANFEVYSMYTSARFYLVNTSVKKEMDAINYSFGLSFRLAK